MNVVSNFISNKFVTFIKDRDPPWMTANIKDKINYRNNIYRKYLKKGEQQVHYIKLQNTIKELSKLILTRRDDYNRNFPNKLIDPTISSKACWPVMKTFYNCKKVPIIPLLLISDKLESDFKKKAHHFKVFFASKCTPLINNSVIPDSFDYVSTVRLSSVIFNNVDILKIIKSLNVNKAHGNEDE